MNVLWGLMGIAGLLGIALLFSEARKAIPLRVVAAGVLVQIILALVFTHLPPAVAGIRHLAHAIDALQRATDAGTSFVFGYLGGAALPFAETKPGASFILAFRAFPLVLTISALASLLLHWGVLQRVVGALAWGLCKAAGIGGARHLALRIEAGVIKIADGRAYAPFAANQCGHFGLDIEPAIARRDVRSLFGLQRDDVAYAHVGNQWCRIGKVGNVGIGQSGGNRR